MSSHIHVHLHVSDLEASGAFYRSFFGTEPAKERPGYLKFLPELGPVNLALSAGALATGRNAPVNHLGIQVDDAATVARELGRVQAAGLDVRVETGVDCCHANQDKFWVVDPDGVEWEVYHLNYDLETPAETQVCAPSTDGPCCS